MMRRFEQALAALDRPRATFSALESLVRETVGVGLFTLTEIDHARGLASRIYSNQPGAYPVHGQKEVVPNRWATAVLDRHKTIVASTIDDIATVSPDHELIRSLGYEGCMNVPVIVGGTVIGTLNCLDVRGHYTRQSARRCLSLEAAGRTGVSAERRWQKRRWLAPTWGICVRVPDYCSAHAWQPSGSGLQVSQGVGDAVSRQVPGGDAGSARLPGCRQWHCDGRGSG